MHPQPPIHRPIKKLVVVDEPNQQFKPEIIATPIPLQSIFNSSNYSYDNIDIKSVDFLAQHIVIPDLEILKIDENLKAVSTARLLSTARHAIIKSVKELLEDGAIIRRVLNVSVDVTEKMCKKDFVDTQLMRVNAPKMARSMTAGKMKKRTYNRFFGGGGITEWLQTGVLL